MLDWTDRPAGRDARSARPDGARTRSRTRSGFSAPRRKARPGGVVRVITGRGRGGGGAPIRTRVRTLLRTLRDEGAVVRDYVLEDSEGSFLVRLR